MTGVGRDRCSKVSLYVTWRGRLLVFLQPDDPDIRLQIPGGTVEPHETFEAAAARELYEETGITAIAGLRFLAQQEYRFVAFGFDQIHDRHYFHVKLAPTFEAKARWLHVERHSSVTSKPITLALAWAELDDAERDLGYGFGHALPQLRSLLGAADIE